MICKVRKAVERYNMALRGKRVVVALSGGADSMALLYSLYSLRDEYDIRLEACHINHGIRGEDAKRDECFVKSECEKLGVKLHVFSYNVPAAAKERKLGLEECGRQMRYEAFSSLGDCLVATAHTLSDRCETLLLNETRGASLKGICSIPAVRGNIIRPLIDCTRDEIEEYCARNSISYVTDETNFDDLYSRNRIRLNVIPELKKINPSFEKAISRLISSADEAQSYLQEETLKALNGARLENGYNADAIKAQHPLIRKRVLAEIISREAGVKPELVHLELAEGILDGGTVQIIGETVIAVKGSVLYVNPIAEETDEWEYDFSDFQASFNGRKVKATVFNKNDVSPKQFVHNKVLDYDAVVGKCIIRNRRAGDKMRIAGSSCTKTLKKLFNEKKPEGRNNLMILADEDGILWVEKLGCADRAKITEKTKKIIVIEDIADN